jgi:hypothetical protein
MNIKFLNGKKGDVDSKAPSIRKRNGQDRKRVNPKVFDGLFRSYKGLDSVVQSFPNRKTPYKGVAQAFGERYSSGSIETLRNFPKKPWNVHVALTTTAVKKEALKKGVDAIASELKNDFYSLLSPKEKQTIREDIETLKIQDNAIVLWGRLSGQKGAAHPESDSDPVVWDSLISHLKARYPNRQIVLIGDEIKVNETNKKNVVQIHEYWNNLSLVTPYKEGKICQDYFSSILVEKKCTLIGMKSGNHHNYVFLGGKVIYFDDLQSNNSGAGREEDLAGKSARGRARLSKKGETEDLLLKRELKKSGAFPNYRRLATQAQLGYYSKYQQAKTALLEKLNTVDNVLNKQEVVKLTRGQTFSEFLTELKGHLSTLSESFKGSKLQSEKNTQSYDAILSLDKFISQLQVSPIDDQEPLEEINFEEIPKAKPDKVSDDVWTDFRETLNAVQASYAKANLFKRTMVSFALVPLKNTMTKVVNATWVNDKALHALTEQLTHIQKDLIQTKSNLKAETKVCIKQVGNIKQKLNDWIQKLGVQAHELNELDALMSTLNALELESEKKATKEAAILTDFTELF